jgi:dCMP deaminase
MFIAIIGLRFSGKSTVENYLIAKGFTSVQLCNKDVEITASVKNQVIPQALPLLSVQTNNIIGDDHGRLLVLDSPTSPSSSQYSNRKTLSFGSPALLLDHVTQHWRSNFVTTDLDSDRLVNYFIRRPFFMLISIDAPILQRYHRCQGLVNITTLEDFVREHDREVFGDRAGPDSPGGFSLLRRASPQVKLKIVNSFPSIAELHYHLDALDITNRNRLRPQWDTYFMTLADLASQRSNCMKRRVGAILVRENRIVSTGYVQIALRALKLSSRSTVIMAPLVASKTAMKGGADIAIAHLQLMVPNVFAYMPKKMRFWKQEEIGLARTPLCIAIHVRV